MRVLSALVLGIVASCAATARAAWMTDGVRNISTPAAWFAGVGITACRFSQNILYCPFVSDTDTFFGGDNSNIYVDYNQTHVSGSVTSSACRQSWTGSAYTCASGTSTSSSGFHDVLINGFSAISGTPSVYDYFFVVISATGVNEGAIPLGLNFI